MRLFKQFSSTNDERTLTGSLLIAHPSQSEGYFKHAVILMIVHSAEDGSLGLVMNRPLNQSLGDYSEEFAKSKLASVPLFAGGPVNEKQLILVAWKQNEEAGTLQFCFGIDESKALEIIASDPQFELRGFLGYSGWCEGQLQKELKMDAWVLTELSAELPKLSAPLIWRTLLASENPEMRLLAEEPQDLSLN